MSVQRPLSIDAFDKRCDTCPGQEKGWGGQCHPPPRPPALTTLREAPQLVSDLISADCAHTACSGESLRCCLRCRLQFCQLCPTTTPHQSCPKAQQRAPSPGAPRPGALSLRGHLAQDLPACSHGAATTCSTSCSPGSGFPLCLSPGCLTSPCACHAGS